MARYKPYNLKQAKMITLSYADQLVEGSFEHALDEIVEEHLDMSVFEARYGNDAGGRPAYDPKILLKVVLYGYYKGIVSSRRLEEACRRNVIFMALSADSRPHFTTIAGFVSELGGEIVSVFRDVLVYASELGLIGKEHFAVDGCKLPSNASKQWSGTHQELEERARKLETMAERIVERHKARDKDENEPLDPEPRGDKDKAERYRAKVAKIKTFLAERDKKLGPTGKEHKSNITDPDSAKMATSHGVIQGYNGLAVVDGKTQIVVHAEAYGSGAESDRLVPLVEAAVETFSAIGEKRLLERVKVTADAGFHCRATLTVVESKGINAFVADRNYRRRDPAFAEAKKYKVRHNEERARRREKEKAENPKPANNGRFSLKDFVYDEAKEACICPAGQKMYKSGTNMRWNGYRVAHFKAPITTCRGCPLRSQCLRHPERTIQRQVTIIKGRDGPKPKPPSRDGPSERMRRKFDSRLGREIYGRRMATVEPVFANLQNKGMRRFTLRGKTKVSAQWKLFTLVHNIEKIAHFG